MTSATFWGPQSGLSLKCFTQPNTEAHLCRRDAIQRATDPQKAEQERLERPPHLLGAAAQRPYISRTRLASRYQPHSPLTHSSY